MILPTFISRLASLILNFLLSRHSLLLYANSIYFNENRLDKDHLLRIRTLSVLYAHENSPKLLAFDKYLGLYFAYYSFFINLFYVSQLLFSTNWLHLVSFTSLSLLI